MKELVKNLIAAVITALVTSLITLNMLATVVTLISFIGFKYLTDKIVLHIAEKKMPTVYQWIKYSCALVANILMIAGLYYGSRYCLIVAGIVLIAGIVTKAIEYKKLKTVA